MCGMCMVVWYVYGCVVRVCVVCHGYSRKNEVMFAGIYVLMLFKVSCACGVRLNDISFM